MKTAQIDDFLLISCNNQVDPLEEENNDTATLPSVYEKVYNVEEIYLDGDDIVITTKDLPDHGSLFYPEGGIV